MWIVESLTRVDDPPCSPSGSCGLWSHGLEWMTSLAHHQAHVDCGVMDYRVDDQPCSPSGSCGLWSFGLEWMTGPAQRQAHVDCGVVD